MSIFDLMALPWRLQGAMAGYAAGAQRHTCRSCGLPESSAGHFRHFGEWLCSPCWRMYLSSGPAWAIAPRPVSRAEAEERWPRSPAPAITDGQLRAALLRDLDPAATVQVRDADGSWIYGDCQS